MKKKMFNYKLLFKVKKYISMQMGVRSTLSKRGLVSD